MQRFSKATGLSPVQPDAASARGARAARACHRQGSAGCAQQQTASCDAAHGAGVMSIGTAADTPLVSYRALERATVDPVPAVDLPLPARVAAGRRDTGGDRRAVLVILAALAALTALSWRRWGYPTFDPGLDLSVADQVAHGAVPYRDSRYFYGPAGLYSLALAFKVFGTSLTTAFAFGYVQTIAILASFYALRATYLRPVTATLATLLVLAIAFNGSFFDFVLPHTNSGTFGCLFLSSWSWPSRAGGSWRAGAAAGVLALTRPEFALFGAAAGAGAVLGRAREAGVRAAARAAAAMTVPALSWRAPSTSRSPPPPERTSSSSRTSSRSTSRRAVGNKLQGDWAPFDATSFVAFARPGLVYGSLLGAAVVAATRWRRSRAGRAGPARGGGDAAVVARRGLARPGLLPRHPGHDRGRGHAAGHRDERLPVPAILAAVWAAGRALRNRPAPFLTWTRTWRCSSAPPRPRAAPTTASRWTPTRPTTRRCRCWSPRWCTSAWPTAGRAPGGGAGALGAMAAALALNAYAGHYRDDTTLIRTPRGSYMGFTPAGPATQGTIDFLAAHTRPGEPMLSVPDDPGFHFLADLRPALRELTFVPGTLDTAADERTAIARLQRVRPRFVVVGAKTFDQYVYPPLRVGLQPGAGPLPEPHYRRVAAFGDVAHPQRNAFPSQAFSVLLRRGASLQPARTG